MYRFYIDLILYLQIYLKL